MFRFIFIILIVCSGMLSGIANAGWDCGAGGCPTSVNNSIIRNLSSGENEFGQQVNSNNVVTPESVINFSGGDLGVAASEWVVFSGEAVPALGSGYNNWNFRKIDDYLSLGIKYVSNCGVTSYAPFNQRIQTQGSCVPWVTVSGTWYSRQFQTAMRIDKKIVSGTYSKNILIGQYGLCWPAGSDCRSKRITVMNLYVNLDVTVPQTCTINAGQVINIDFGNLSSGAFALAGARPEGVNDIVRSIPIECDGIAANTAMTLRLQADKVSGNAVVTNANDDVGFVVADGSGTALTPNNLSSVIPFSLGNDNKSSVTIRVYPVSVTGNKPAEGPVTSQAYLRVDFA
ncbi:fimbrial protein [Serratia ureilytica]|uniref:fimbrial protein n=1 Tax=Serratia ureilytica TaxID=300181 RepID=UPI001E34FA99|nr:fimbrial protein [Serratia ureilytica]